MAHFYEMIPAEIRALSNHEAVERYATGADWPADAIAGLTREQLTAFPVPGTWSIQQIVVHLADTDQAAAYRWKRIIAEDEPTLDAYDENAFVRGLFYQELDARLAAELFRVNRLHTAGVLRRLPEQAFERAARHPEVGEIRLGQFVRLYVHHLEHHLKFIRQKRALVGG
jgi:hypothetical protein